MAVRNRAHRPDSERCHCGGDQAHEGWTQTRHRPAHAGSRLKLADVLGRPRLKGQPSSRTGENPPYGMIGGSRRRRHHSKPGPRLGPTRPIHIDLEPCAVACEGGSEASAEEHIGQPLSPAKIHIPGADAVAKAESYTDGRASASAWRTRRGRRRYEG